MTISVNGIDTGYSYVIQQQCEFDVWATQGQNTDAGTLSLVMPNQSGRFSERIFERLRLAAGLFDGTISGVVTQSGIGPVERVVRVYRRSDGQMAGETRSDPGTGAYSFSNLLVGEEYFVVAFDDTTSSPDFNAIIYDRVEA